VANVGTNTSIMPPMGARFRLKASVDLSQLNPESRIIAQAMKDYGMIVADNGSNFFFSGASDSVDASNNLTLTWNDNDIQDTAHGLKSLTFSDFEVVDLTPVVTGLSANQAQAGSQITVTGQNFSGAAGHLQVFFGSTPATSVTYIDDGHLLVTVPSGTGSVDVRVQSGITTPADSENVESTIFGYGLSANNAVDVFTFGAATTNAAPTVATQASASPNVITGTATNLSVLGADDGGEAKLTYTWSVTSKPTGAADPTYSANGTNAAKNTTATFTMSGSYILKVTITDAQGLTTSSSVTVNVQLPANTAPTVAVPASANPAIVTGATTTLTVLGADDGGEAKLTYTWAVVSKPAGAAAPTYSVNGSNAAKTTIATFYQAGVYIFQVTIKDAQGLTVTSAVTVTVKQTEKSIRVTPTTPWVATGGSLQFSAVAYDQFGKAFTHAPTFVWRLSGRGTVTQTGLYKAPATYGWPYTVTASAAGVVGSTLVYVVPPSWL
jgi:hypothetical protein